MSWNKIDNLFKKVEAFYKNALWSELVSKAQDNKKDTNDARWDGKSEDASKETAAEKASRLWLEQEEEKLRNKGKPAPVDVPEAPTSIKPETTSAIDYGMYNQIVSFAKEPYAEEVRGELRDIAKLYKEACEGNAKFSTVAKELGKFINNTIPSYYSDFDDAEDIEEGEDGTPEQIAKREGENVEEFIKNVYDNVDQRFKRQVEKEKGFVDPTQQAPEGDTESPEEKEAREAQEEIDNSPGDITAPTAKKVDMKDLTSLNGNKQGASAQNERNYKDWIRSCEQDILRHNEDLKTIKDPKFKKILVEKINVLNQLLPLLKAEKKILEDPSVARAVENRRTVPTDPDKRQEFDYIKENEKILKNKNSYLKSQLRTLNVLQQNEELNEKLNNSRSPKEKAYLTQQIELNNLIASPDKNKIAEIEARRRFLKAMLPRAPEMDKRTGVIEDRPEVYLSNISPAMMAKCLQDIQDASLNKISLSDFHKQEAAKIKKRFQYEGNRRGLPLAIEGVFTQFKQSVASVKNGYKKKVVKEWKETKNTNYASYRDAISLALQNGDASALERAEGSYQKKLLDDAENHPLVQHFDTFSHAFYAYLKELESLHKQENKSMQSGTVLLTSVDQEVISKLLDEGERLLKLELIRNPGIGPRGTSNFAKALEMIIKQLKERMPTEKQSTGFNKMTLKQKIAALQIYLEKKAAVQKLADDGGDTNFYAGTLHELPGLIPDPSAPATGLKMSKQEADVKALEIMDNIIDGIHIKSLDD